MLFNVVLGGIFSDLLMLVVNNGGYGFDLNELNMLDMNVFMVFVINFV